VSLVWIVVAVAGALMLGLSVLGARHPTIHPAEARAFRAVNGLPGWLIVPLWAPMQLGNLVVGLLAGLAVTLVQGDRLAAVAVVAMTALKLVVERLMRRAMAPWLPVRQRPGTSQTGAVLRGGDVPASGPSFPSGHVILAGGLACVVGTSVPALAGAGAVALGALVGFGRVYVGAHNPLDVTAGLGAGLLVGAILAEFLVA
jgi:membrane-associated phospholipid phosphatase